ncbi:Uncharacterised protein [Legionella israelensis]|uniref:Uncharacterized protein n=1 Tax=Legionella israelensis TaxID=454 RepID=A0A0W0V2X8_9GAMM|nr:hypothetical protein Lisr_2694 [Legionella israelensis]SCX89807.1 hypothetical protein SAMN02746069_00589 [Legionella israelensis DSM 19235]STX60219.1 Uncharacterised protein [Legionella israelensis]
MLRFLVILVRWPSSQKGLVVITQARKAEHTCSFYYSGPAEGVASMFPSPDLSLSKPFLAESLAP